MNQLVFKFFAKDSINFSFLSLKYTDKILHFIAYFFPVGHPKIILINPFICLVLINISLKDHTFPMNEFFFKNSLVSGPVFLIESQNLLIITWKLIQTLTHLSKLNFPLESEHWNTFFSSLWFFNTVFYWSWPVHFSTQKKAKTIF